MARSAHGFTLLGAAIVVFGATSLEWQRFELAGVGAYGYEVPLVAQGVLALAVVIGAAALLGLARPRRATAVTAPGALFLAGWVAAAHLERAPGLPLMSGELVTLGPGFTAAALGATLCLVGAVAALVLRRQA